MPCCLVIILSLLIPRIMIIILWLFTAWFKGIFNAAIIPLLGFIFLPVTLLWYSAVANWYGGHWGLWQIVGLVIAVLIDLSPHEGGRRTRNRRRAETPLP